MIINLNVAVPRIAKMYILHFGYWENKNKNAKSLNRQIMTIAKKSYPCMKRGQSGRAYVGSSMFLGDKEIRLLHYGLLYGTLEIFN